MVDVLQVLFYLSEREGFSAVRVSIVEAVLGSTSGSLVSEEFVVVISSNSSRTWIISIRSDRGLQTSGGDQLSRAHQEQL